MKYIKVSWPDKGQVEFHYQLVIFQGSPMESISIF